MSKLSKHHRHVYICNGLQFGTILLERLTLALNSSILVAGTRCKIRINGFITPNDVQFANANNRTAALMSFVNSYRIPEIAIQKSTAVGFALTKASIRFSGPYLDRINGIPYVVNNVFDYNLIELEHTGNINHLHDELAFPENSTVDNTTTVDIFGQFIQQNRGCMTTTRNSLFDVDTMDTEQVLNVRSDMKISGVTNIDGHLTFGNAEALYEEKSISIAFKQKQSLEIQNDMENSFKIETTSGTNLLSFDTLIGDESIKVNADFDINGSTRIMGDLTLENNLILNSGLMDFSTAPEGTHFLLNDNQLDALTIEAVNAPKLMRFDTLNERVLVNGHVIVNGLLEYEPPKIHFENDVAYIPPGSSEVIIDSKHLTNKLYLPLIGQSLKVVVDSIDTDKKDIVVRYPFVEFVENEIVAISGDGCVLFKRRLFQSKKQYKKMIQQKQRRCL